MTIAIDRESLLVDAPGSAALRDVEAVLEREGLTLGVGAAGIFTTVTAWLTKGAPGAPDPFADPVDHLVAGITMTLPGGKVVDVRPSPRRAVGPDLVALMTFPGVRVDRAWLRVHRRDARRPSLPTPGFDRDAPLSEGESRLVDAILAQLSAK